MALLFFVLAAMNSLVPGKDHSANATAIASVLLSEPSLFRDDESRMKTAALVVAIAFRESAFKNDARSSTNDHCMMQVNRRPELADDPEACIRVGLAMLRESMRICPAHPLAFYASGPGGCDNARAQRISRDRMAIAKRLERISKGDHR